MKAAGHELPNMPRQGADAERYIDITRRAVKDLEIGWDDKNEYGIASAAARTAYAAVGFLLSIGYPVEAILAEHARCLRDLIHPDGTVKMNEHNIVTTPDGFKKAEHERLIGEHAIAAIAANVRVKPAEPAPGQ